MYKTEGSPMYVLSIEEDGILITDSSFTSFWKQKEMIPTLPSTYKLQLPVNVPAHQFFDYRSAISCNSYDVALIGIPYNRGATFADSCVRGFPDSLRLASLRYPVYPLLESAAASGLYDLNHQRFLFRGLMLQDIGNLDEASVESPIALDRSIQQVSRWALKHTTTLVALGGDHSVTYPLVCRLAEALQQTIIFIDLDAHHDCKTGPIEGTELSHATFIRHLLDRDEIGAILQIGGRGIRSLSQLVTHPKLMQIPAQTIRVQKLRYALQNLKRRIPHAAIYLSVDLDVIDPTLFPWVDFPVAGGLTIETIIDLLWEVFHGPLPVAGVDLVEGLSGGDIDRNAYDVALYILAYCLDGICFQRYKSGIKKLIGGFK